jgi:aminoglycoside phosphotransferase (APT) family kinase protein
MHADEVGIDLDLVRRLVATQFPQWADLPLQAIDSAATDNAIYRLGDELTVRLPRVAGATGQIEDERRWLPRLAPHLPLAVPAPLATGAPAAGYPYPWSVSRWVPGEPATADRLADLCQAARDLAHFITVLQRIEPYGAPDSPRGVPLARRDARTRGAIAALEGKLDTDAVTTAWRAALQAPPWGGPPVWTHGDLYDGNLLADGGRLSGVIDFGSSASAIPPAT